MDLRIRGFLDDIISLVNSYDDIPLEARRLALESAMYNCERAANKAIQAQSMEQAQKITKELTQEINDEDNENQLNYTKVEFDNSYSALTSIPDNED